MGESAFERAAQLFAHTWSIARSAEVVWAELVGERPLHWCRGLSIRWTSPPPFGVGTTRRAKAIGGVMTADECFFIWDEGRRYAFYVAHLNLPLFTILAEDYVVEPDGLDRCRFTWRIGLSPSAFGRPGVPLSKLMFRRFFRDTGRYFNAA